MDFDKMKGRYVLYRSYLSGYRERVKQSRLWYRQEQTEFQTGEKKANMPTSHSGHIFNAIQYKHADLMDNYPAANILPREPGDEESARILTEIVPFILERCHFKRAYDLNLYNKLISGTAAYGVFFNPEKDNGRGEIEVKEIEMLNLSWQPDAGTISDSKYIFYDTFMDADEFLELYGTLDGVTVQATYDEQKELTGLDVGETVVLTDAYYKKTLRNGKKVLHYARFSGERLLFSSEDDKRFQNGFYAHGEYPIVFDLMNPIPGELTGMGLVDVAKDMQGYIDRLDEAINLNCLLCAKPRYMMSENSGMSEDEFLDCSRTLVHVRGSVEENRIRKIDMENLPGFIIDHRNKKIDELKEITGNRDFAQGGSSGGVTAASAITALQTASDKLVRDCVTYSYIAFEQIVRLVIELIREFYTEQRIFRITGDDGKNTYKTVSSSELFSGGERSVYDISLTTEKNNPYNRATHNALILELNAAGLLATENFENASFVLKNLNFDGKEKLIRDLEERYTQKVQQAQMAQMQAQAQAQAQAQQAQMAQAQDQAQPQPQNAGELVEIPLGNAAEIDTGAPEERTQKEGGELVEIPIE